MLIVGTWAPPDVGAVSGTLEQGHGVGLLTMSSVNDIRTLVASGMTALELKRKHGILWRDIATQARGFFGLGAAAYERRTVVSADRPSGS